ncbi:MAG: AlpA family transcriptional regulator [Nevskia sp.]|nr:AlpA family transcriptional regulator [Nevskia sp.]
MAKNWKRLLRPGRRRRGSHHAAEADRQLSLQLDPPVAAAAPPAVVPPVPGSNPDAVVRTSPADVANNGGSGSGRVGADPAPSDSLLRLPAVRAATGLSRSTIYERIRKGTFPAPVRLGEATVGWPASRINEWIQRRMNDHAGGRLHTRT